MKAFIGKTALITGGSSGIGLALARNLASRGANIWLLARNPEKLESACQEVSGSRISAEQKVGIIPADISNYEQVTQALWNVFENNAPDLLINSAGITLPGIFEELDISIFHQMMEVNYFGTLYVTKALTPAMIRRKSGHIVNISSMAGIHGLYGYSAYGPSKFAVRGLSDVLRYELKPQGIQVSIVFPADTQTPQLELENKLKPPVLKELISGNSKVATPEETAEKIIQGIIKDRYLILPSFDSFLWYTVTVLLPGHAMYWLVDRLMDRARRQVAKNLTGKQ